MNFLNKWIKKNADTITYYASASSTGIAGASMLISYACDKSKSGFFPIGGLYLLSLSIPLGFLAHSTAKTTKMKYRELNEGIDLHGFNDQLLIECSESSSTRNLVEIIAEEKQLTKEYRDSKEAFDPLSYLSNDSF
ncbi:MAG: hypothetical protein WCE90_09225 [Candidatus Zixiibacteriota bacterium]